jgi:6-phosphogluconate dehydrogenase
VIRSWLLELCADILRHDEDLSQIAPVVPDSGEGRWTRSRRSSSACLLR